MVQRVDRRGVIDLPGSAGVSSWWCGLDFLLSPVPVRLEMTPLGVIFQPCQIAVSSCLCNGCTPFTVFLLSALSEAHCFLCRSSSFFPSDRHTSAFGLVSFDPRAVL